MIAVFDIGKTNKKCLIFDEDYRVVFEKSDQLPETLDEDGEPCEDLDVLQNWVLSTLREILHDPRFQIQALQATTYGASLVHLDRDGQPLTPLYNYLRAFPDDLQKQFFDHHGDESAIALETASPVLGNLNAGLQLYWLKHRRPLIFKQILWSMHLPQYIAYLISNNLAGLRPQIPRDTLNDKAIKSGGDLQSPPGYAASEITSIGCHTLLWDFGKNDYHDWVKAEGLTAKFPPIKSSNAALSITDDQPAKIRVGVGLHDSSAALIPYLAYFDEPFILISTGTWCISLNPFNDEPLTAGELRQDCLCYLSYTGRPVKAARYFGGQEHEQGVQALAAQFGVGMDFHHAAEHSGQAELLESYRRLLEQLVKKQVYATRLALGTSPVRRLFVDGGFAKNELYLTLLAGAFPEMEVFAAEMAQATALGAALAMHDCWNAKALPLHLILLKKYSVTQP